MQRVGGEKAGQMLRYRDGPDPRTATAVRDAEGLVQVEMGDIATELAWFGQSEQGVEIGAIQIDLTAVFVHQVAQWRDRVLVGAVGGRVGDHQRGKIMCVLRALDPQVVQIDRSVVGCAYDHDAQSGHHGGGRIGAVRAGRDQADVATRVAVRPVVAADGEQAGQLAL